MNNIRQSGTSPKKNHALVKPPQRITALYAGGNIGTKRKKPENTEVLPIISRIE